MTLSIELRGVSVALRGREVLQDVTATIEAGRLVALIGPNGAGKSTLLKAIAGLLAPARGSIAFTRNGQPIVMGRAERARHLAYLPQERTLAWPMRARAIVALGRLPSRPNGAAEAPADHAAVDGAMRDMDIAEFADRPVDELSGGERARVLVARALAQEPDILLADEPSAALDPRHQLGLFETLKRRAEAGRIVIVALHDLTAAARFAGKVVLMHQGRIVAAGPPRTVLTPGNLRNVYGIDSEIIDVAGLPIVVPLTGRTDLKP